jgi:thiol-disulfide isomerase/thioredoxin
MKVLAYLSASLLFAPLAAGDTILLEFSGNYCPPCRQMEPVVAGLEREGYRVERVRVEMSENRSKIDQYRVKGIPTFIVLKDGVETGRLVGAVPAADIKKLLGPPPAAAPAQAKATPAKPAKGSDFPLPTLTNSERPSDQTLVRRSVRIVVDDAKNRSFGTGTVVRSVPGETLVLTCAHLFQGVGKQAKTTVEFFGLPDRPRLTGEVMARDAESDVCLVRVANSQVVSSARVAGKSFTPQPGIPATSVGCDNGSDPTARHMRVTAVNRYLGAPTIECSGEPVEGRSGGGLFNEAGEIIGVCSARDPSDHRGIYGGLTAIHSILDRNSLASLYQPKAASNSDVALASFENKGQDPVRLPSPGAMGLKVDRDLPLPEGAENAEVVCVIRSLDDPKAPARVVLLNKASPELLTLIDKEQSAQGARSSTSMRRPSRSEATPLLDNSDRVAGSASEPGSDEGWRTARGARERDSKPALEPRAPFEESARWQKDWPVGANAEDGVVRR